MVTMQQLLSLGDYAGDITIIDPTESDADYCLSFNVDESGTLTSTESTYVYEGPSMPSRIKGDISTGVAVITGNYSDEETDWVELKYSKPPTSIGLAEDDIESFVDKCLVELFTEVITSGYRSALI